MARRASVKAVPLQRALAWGCLLVLAHATPAGEPDPAEQAKKERAALLKVSPVQLGTPAFRHGWHSFAVSFSRDGKLLASTGWDGTVRVWEAATGREKARWTSPDRDTLWGVDFSPTDDSVLVFNTSKSVYRWEWRDNRDPRPVNPPVRVEDPKRWRAHIDGVAFSRDGKSIGWSHWGAGVRVMDLASRQILFEDDAFSTIFAFSTTSSLLAYVDSAGRIVLQDFRNKKQIGRMNPPDARVFDLAFSLDGSLLAEVSGDGSCRVWDVASKKVRFRLKGHGGDFTTCGFTADGKRLVTGDVEGVIRLWELPTGKPLAQFQGCPMDVVHMSVSPRGAVLACTSQSETIRLWDLDRRVELTPGSHFRRIASVAFSPDGSSLASLDWDSTIVRWDCQTQRPLSRLSPARRQFSEATLSPDAGRAAFARTDGSLEVWDVPGGKRLRNLSGHTGGAGRLLFSPDGRTLIGVDQELDALAWDLGSGRVSARTRLEECPSAAAMSPVGLTAAFGSNAGVERWDVTGQERPQRLPFPGKEEKKAVHEVNALTYSPDGRVLAVGIEPRAIRLFDNLTGGQVAELSPVRARDKITSLCFAGPRLLASGCHDGSLQLWDVAAAEELTALREDGGDTEALAWCARTGRLASGHADTTVLLWDLHGPLKALKSNLTAPVPPSIKELWENLAEPGMPAYRAVWRLAVSPRESVPFLKERLPPIRVPREEIARAVAQLSDPRFQKRQEAAAQLESHGDLAIPALRRRLQEKPELAERKLIEELLPRLSVWKPAQLRYARAVQALEYAEDPAATALLETLAGGPPESRITEQAKAALARLKQATAKKE